MKGKPFKSGEGDDACSHSGRVNGLEFTSDGLHLLSLGNDSKLKKWDIATGENLKANFTQISVKRKTRVPFCVADDYVMFPSGSSLSLEDTKDYSRIASLQGHYGNANCCSYSSELNEFYSGGNDRHVLIWDSNTARSESWKEEENIKLKMRGPESTRSLLGMVTVDMWSDDDGDEAGDGESYGGDNDYDID